MIVVYTGNGKGKTSACIGQTVRALGQGLRVAFHQYMKRDGAGGEQHILRNLLGEAFCAGGVGFLRNPEQFPEHRAAALRLTARTLTLVPELDVLVLDEALYALKSGVLTEEELRSVIAACDAHGAHLILSGRGAPAWLCEAAHIVTEMTESKHPYAHGGKAVRGIEF